MSDVHPLITRDPVSGGELIVTRLECPESGIVIEGRFSLGWIGRLTVEQLEFAGLLVRHLPSYDEVANIAVFAASDWARTITASEINFTGGAVVD